MSADYNGWADRPEEEREGEEIAAEVYAAAPVIPRGGDSRGEY